VQHIALNAVPQLHLRSGAGVTGGEAEQAALTK